jgi:hypothetical protein
MVAISLLLVRMLCDFFKPRPWLEAEILILRHQLNVLQRRAPRRVHLRWVDRALLIWLYRRCPRILQAITMVRPETVLRWHRMGLAAYWRFKSRSPGGRPRIAKEVRDLIRRMSLENPFWGATKIHGELRKLGIAVAQSTVSIYMVPRPDRPLQTWTTFVRNHMDGIASIDLFVVPTIAFQQLFALLVLGHERRRLLWFAVTRNPTAEWLARQITEAFPWDSAPKYLIRDNDRAFGAAFTARVRAMGIRDRPTSFRSMSCCFKPTQPEWCGCGFKKRCQFAEPCPARSGLREHWESRHCCSYIQRREGRPTRRKPGSKSPRWLGDRSDPYRAIPMRSLSV